MSKRRKELPSSLELFLDTICNTFGGIVFLAILLSVIVQNRVKVARADSSVPSITVEQAHLLAIRSESLSDRLSQLKEIVGELASMQPKGDGKMLDELSQTVKKIAEQLEEEVRRQSDLSETLRSQSARNLELLEAITQADDAALETRKRIDEEKARLREQLDARTVVLKVPKVESVAKRSDILLMRYGKAYRLQREDGEVDPKHMKVLSESARSVKVEPRKESGWELHAIADRNLLLDHLRHYPPMSYAIRIYVWPDSFDEFAGLKQLLLEQDYQYELEPYAEGNSITFVQGNHTPVVQ